MYIGGIPRQFDQDLVVISDVLQNFLYESTCRKLHTQFFEIFFTSRFFFKRKNHRFLEYEKIHINLIRYIKIFEPY